MSERHLNNFCRRLGVKATMQLSLADVDVTAERLVGLLFEALR
jgi:hypothetical protein